MSSGNGARPPAIPGSLDRLRLRLTAWYVGTFFAILTLLGIGVFAVITWRFDRELDLSLGQATAELRRLGRADAADGLRIPERTLFVADSAGRPVGREAAPSWLQQLARDASRRAGRATAVHTESDRILRANAEPFRLGDGRAVVAIAVADEIELEDRYAALIAAFGAAALFALVLVAVGGWLLARQSTAPVERAVAHMRRFMADAAHELRTPLTVIRARAEVALQREREPEQYVVSLRGIERETERLTRIVEDLLMLARADAGERPIERRRVFLDDLTSDAAETARVIADRRSVRLDVDEFEEAAVSGDPALLRQLVVILLDNAIKFTEPGGTVRLGVRSQGASATLTVSDTGIGIAPDQIGHVFERFYRGDPARTRRPGRDGSMSEGAGLGLSIAQWIAEEHGGTVRVESEAGRGTRVIAQFPLAAADSASSALSSS
ncbi:MAG: ATP-binding protein [bacterium]